MSIKIIAEIGINANGDVDNVKRLVDIAAFAGCDYVKFQKRTPDICVPEDQKNKIRKTPWGEMTYLEYKHRMEFDLSQYREIDRYCLRKGIGWFASVWDIPSSEFMQQFTDIAKIPSALITDTELCRDARKRFSTLLVSTGMSTEKEIKRCVEGCDPDIIFHTNSTYPCPEEELGLRYIEHLKELYPDKVIGYSGHEFGLVTTFATIPMGVEYIERHICLSRTDWGSDQMASVEPHGLIKLVKGIRNVEKALGEKVAERVVSAGELPKRKSLRGE